MTLRGSSASIARRSAKTWPAIKTTWGEIIASTSPIDGVTIAGSWQQQQGRIQCSYCDKAFHKDSLNRHVKNIHGPAQTFLCQYCQKNFKNSDSLHDHQSRVCKFVPAVRRQSDYAIWNICICLSLLKIYILGDRAQCKFCGKWLHKRGLKRHMKDVHGNEVGTSENEYVCHLCERSFKTEQYLKNHLRVSHSIYQQQSMFWTHYFFVIGEKQRCELCGKLVHPRALKRHIQLAHSTIEEASQCHLCQAVVKSSMYLKDHLRRKHNVYQSWVLENKRPKQMLSPFRLDWWWGEGPVQCLHEAAPPARHEETLEWSSRWVSGPQVPCLLRNFPK